MKKTKNIRNQNTKPVDGEIVNCGYARLREKPDLESKELTLMMNGAPVKVFTDFKHKDFYKIQYQDPWYYDNEPKIKETLTGYCMKTLIKIK